MLLLKVIPGVDASKRIQKTLNKLNQQIAKVAPGTAEPTVMSALVTQKYRCRAYN